MSARNKELESELEKLRGCHVALQHQLATTKKHAGELSAVAAVRRSAADEAHSQVRHLEDEAADRTAHAALLEARVHELEAKIEQAGATRSAVELCASLMTCFRVHCCR